MKLDQIDSVEGREALEARGRTNLRPATSNGRSNGENGHGKASPEMGTRVMDAPKSKSSSGPAIKREIRDDQICVLTFDRPDSAANIFDAQTLTELGEHLEFVAKSPELKGLILTSAKRSIFIAGADLKSMSQAASADDIRKLIELGQNVFNQLAALRIPTVAAVHGAAVGGGYEVCLACDYRVASNDKATKLGLPEIMLGLLPAWGGSTRLPRLIGLPKALDIILAGKTVAAKPALKRGMVDEVVPVEYLMSAATKILKRGKPQRKRHALVNNALTASAIRMRLHSKLLKKTRGHYPAVLKALDVVTSGVFKSIEVSLQQEREGVLELVQTEACRNLIRIFFLQERAKKRSLPDRSAAASTAEAKAISRTAVIGAGVMGAGIAQWLSARQLPVILRDINTEQVAKGMATISKLYRDGTKRHVFTPIEARHGLDRVYPAPQEVPLKNLDLVIEAAVERLDLKKQLFERLGALAGENTILATNTSALPIGQIAAATRHPERVLGLHFFNPVHRMQLVEVVVAPQTSPEVAQRGLRFVQQIGKLPVLVKDSPGFVVNRILMPYLVEAGSLFEAGASVADLDEAMLDFGMPMGPMTLLDEVGIDVALHVAQTLAASFPDRMTIPPLLKKMVEAKLFGKKVGRGFYLHRKKSEPQPNPQALECRSAALTPNLARAAGGSPVLATYQSRMVLLMINEAARCLEEQVVTDPADIDFAMIMGTGFAPFRGGPLRYADSLGVAEVVAALQRFADSGAAHFAPCALLRQMAGQGKKFYQS